MTGIRRLMAKTNIDAAEVFYGLMPGFAAHFALESWAQWFVRAIRGEDIEKDRRFVSSGALIAAFTLTAGARAREIAALRAATVEMRAVLHQAAEDANLRETAAAERDRRLTTLTKWLVLLAALTLGAAIVTLASSR
jgi:uncharacterized membrane protein YoaK (UPF0700 family)